MTRDSNGSQLNIAFTGTLWFWKGPAPWYFVPVPDVLCGDIRDIASLVTYGWGVIPVTVHIGRSTWQTSLFPKDGRYLVPIKARVRAAEQLTEGDEVEVSLDISLSQ